LTNEPPLEAKQRFLRPSLFKPPHELNSSISLRTERAILWAMALHPDDRPTDVTALREALRTGTGLSLRDEGETIIVQPTIRLPSLTSPLDRYLAMTAMGLLLLALILTLFPLPSP
jgi:eukaryotic-like serine/threonine-protein kinase